ncbi:Ohr family peroxiredoxin [Streptomyces sp. NPDC096079]|uniref:Ohr family peroxiredoxin n=1 Tax=Streptomyces sp. NPDC096079 TaxID=3155820 RepID=UPI0033166152
MAVTYTAVVDVDGEGRNGGRARSSDGLLETSLGLPKELGGSGAATNPEQLLAAGWAACFLGALRRAAALRKIRLTSTTITAEITLTHGDDDQFSLSAVLRPVLGGVDHATAQQLAQAAHQICPYSKATRDNVPVVIVADAA